MDDTTFTHAPHPCYFESDATPDKVWAEIDTLGRASKATQVYLKSIA